MKLTEFLVVSLSAVRLAMAQDPAKGAGPGFGGKRGLGGRGGKGFGGPLNSVEGLASVSTGKYSPPVRSFSQQFNDRENLTVRLESLGRPNASAPHHRRPQDHPRGLQNAHSGLGQRWLHPNWEHDVSVPGTAGLARRGHHQQRGHCKGSCDNRLSRQFPAADTVQPHVDG